MSWKIELYRKENGAVPVKEFLESLSQKHRAKAFWVVNNYPQSG